MTLIEVVVAAFCLALIAGASASIFVTGNKSSLALQRNTQLLALADRQIETVRQQVKVYGFSALAMNAAPSSATHSTVGYSSTTHTDPDDFVTSATGCGSSNLAFTIEANWDNTAEGTAPGLASWSSCPSGSEPLVIDTTHGVVQSSQPVTLGSATGTIRTFVTDTYIGCSSSLGSCTSATGDARRVIVAASLSNGGTNNTGAGASYTNGQNSPVYISTIFTNPVPSNQVNNSIGLTLGASVG